MNGYLTAMAATQYQADIRDAARRVRRTRHHPRISREPLSLRGYDVASECDGWSRRKRRSV